MSGKTTVQGHEELTREELINRLQKAEKARDIPLGDRSDRDRDHIINNLIINSKRAYGPGRPRVLGFLRQISISLYDRYLDIYKQFFEICRREGKSFSELCSIAMKEYVETHYPGNPAVPLTAFTENGLKPLRLEVKIVSRKSEWFLEKLENPRVSEGFKKKIRTKDLPPLLLKLARLNLRLRDDGIRGLVERGEKECFGESCV